MSINKFGHFSLDNSRLKAKTILDRNKNLNLNKKRIINLAAPIEDDDAISKVYFLDTLNKMKTKLEHQIKEINIILNNSIKNDVSIIEGLIDQRIKSAFGEELHNINNYLSTIEDYLMRFVVSKQRPTEEDVEVLKIKFPTIKGLTK